MTERQLKLIKPYKNKPESMVQRPKPVPLSPAEEVEAAYFRTMVEARAARQVMLERIMAELTDLDEISPAA